MTRNQRLSAVWVLCALFAVSSFGQDRTMVGTVIDLDEGDNQIQLQLDDAAKTIVMIEGDSVTTTYHGFGTVIADKPEVFIGSQGFSNLREGDRIEVRGPLRGQGSYSAQRVTLLGREVAAGTTGVGQTRDPQRDISTSTGPRTGTGSASTVTGGRIEGTIRQINERDGRLVVETTDRRMVSVATRRNTPVYYRGERYTVTNLEIGDRVRVEADARDAQADDITATRIDVTVSVQDSGTVPGTGTSTVGLLEGRVTRVEPGLDYIYVDDGRGEIRVDMRNAEDARGEILRARDIRVGETVEIAGSMNRVGDMFLASTVRSSGGGGGGGVINVPGGPLNDVARYGLVTITGTVTETLEDAGTIGFRDRDTNTVLRVWVSRDFILRTNAGTHVAASTLRVNDTAVIQAFRDASGNLVAQTIRLRNR